VCTVYDCDVWPLTPPKVSRRLVQFLHQSGYSDILRNGEGRGVPIRDIIVLPFLAVQVPFNCIALVIQHEDDRFDSDSHHDR